MAIDESIIDIRVQRGPMRSAWGVDCDSEVADILLEAARRPIKRRRRIPKPKRDIDEVA